jgi:hypothetical protein
MHAIVLASMSGTVTLVDAAIGILIASALALLLAIRTRRQRQAHETWVARAARTEGTVLSVRETGDVDTVSEYTPLIAYRVGSQEYTIEGQPSHRRNVDVGSRVSLAYEPQHPGSARVATIEKASIFTRVMGIVMLVFLALFATVVSALIRS